MAGCLLIGVPAIGVIYNWVAVCASVKRVVVRSDGRFACFPVSQPSMMFNSFNDQAIADPVSDLIARRCL